MRAALEGLELVHGLLGLGSATGSGSGRGTGFDHRIESGRRIAGYRVVRELGRGGMGTVYEAVHVGLDRPVALKVLGIHAAPDSSARRRFLNEARTAAGLHHTHIVPVFDVGQVGGLCYYAMQRIEGSGLDRVLRHLRRTRPTASGSGDGLAGSWFPKRGSADRPGCVVDPFPAQPALEPAVTGMAVAPAPARRVGPRQPRPRNAPLRPLSVPARQRQRCARSLRAGRFNGLVGHRPQARPATRPVRGEDAAPAAVAPASLAALPAIAPRPTPARRRTAAV